MRTEPKKIGMLTPSSNTVLEPICMEMVRELPNVTCHFSRFEVTKISLEDEALAQFDFEPMLQAAELLAHAEVDVIAWNGTSGGWLGFDVDVKLCKKIEERTGIPATTSMLSQVEAFKAHNIKNIHLVTPYISEINTLIAEQYQQYCDIETLQARGLGQTVNRSFSQVADEKIEAMIQEVAEEQVDGISMVCTNFPGITKVDYYEKKYGIIIYDTINTLLWQCLRMMGQETDTVKGWGGIFHTGPLVVNNS
ncbi:maleate cis-trans isomerase family protein [Gracilibacillus phocaeensis]|uniref:maleate cis-trans isomerase family protein n=1 Tax=Gracilibacillus phocaeensis TaxID=2042304 RepID=UPI00103124FE|nr:aspartate/glutamate racemase family protein [Gracilibacillus phocaeensis]